MIRLPPRSTRTAPLFPYSTLFRSSYVHMLNISGFETIHLNGGTTEISLPATPDSGSVVTTSAPVNVVLGLGKTTFTGSAGNDSIQADRSEEHTSELQSLMRTSYAFFVLKKKNETSVIAAKES